MAASAAKSASETMDMPCLGRPGFKLGMLYDGCNDIPILGDSTLWDANTLKKATKTDSHSGKGREDKVVIERDTLQDKTLHLGIKGGLKLSVLPGGLVKNVSGSAAYLNDFKTSTKQVRVCLKYEVSSKVEKLDMAKVGVPQQLHSIERATHVVTEVQYGAGAFLIFDRHIRQPEEEKRFKGIERIMINTIKALKNDPDLNIDKIVQDKAEAEKYECMLYADSQNPRKLTSFTEAVEVFRKLPEILKGKVMPKTVKLSPLNKLTTNLKPNDQIKVAMVTDIKDSSANVVLTFLEGLHESEIKCNDIKQNPLFSKISRFHDQMSDFEFMVTQFEKSTIKSVIALIPQIRRGEANESELIDKISNDSSPYNSKQLSHFLTQKQEELKRLETCLSQMQDFEFVSSGASLDSITEKYFDYDVVVCFTFNVIKSSEQEPHLLKMKKCLQGESLDSSSQSPLPWYKNSDIMKTIRTQMRQFKDLACANKDNQNAKFVVTDSTHESPNDCILISEHGSSFVTFEPPTTPYKLTAKDSDISHDQITVSWNPPTKESDSLCKYIISYRPESSESTQNWVKEETKGSETTLKITGLNSSTSYIFKVQAQYECDLLGPESSESYPIQTKEFTSESFEPFEEPSEIPQHFEPTDSHDMTPPSGMDDHSVYRTSKPKAVVLNQNSVEVEWQLPEGLTEDDVVYYIVSYQSQSDPAEKWIEKPTGINKLIVSGLNANSKYCFKVKPKCNVGVGIDSEISDPVEIKSIRQPGKPEAMDITPESIQLQWQKPKQEGIEFYILSYQCTNDPEKWKKDMTDDAQAIITRLKSTTSYRFKVRPIFNDGEGIESDVSDPITTKAPICQTNPPSASDADITPNAITLRWNKPVHYSEKVDFYVVSYRVQNDPQSEWRKKTTLKVQEKNSLTIPELTPNTQYIFRVRPDCQSGIKGIESAESSPITTKPVCKPSKPKCIDVTHNSVQLQWDSPEYGSNHVTSYTVLYSTDNPGATWEKHETNKVETKCLVLGLIPSTKYMFKVLPHCTEGVSVESEQSDPTKTKEPVCQPGKPCVIAVANNSVALAWDKPKYYNDNIAFYIVSYGIEEEGHHPSQLTQYSKATPDSNPNLKIENLIPNATYIFKVKPLCQGKASGKEIESELSDPIKLQPRARPTGKPKASSVTHESITLQWEEPEYTENNQIKGYTIHFCKVDDSLANHWNKKVVMGYEKQVTITGLKPNTRYLFRVIPNYDSGDGFESEISEPITTTSLVRLCKPGKPRAITISESYDSIHLEWDKPDYGQDYIESYIVYHKSLSDPSSQWKNQLTDGCKEEINISSLTTNTQYVFKVRPVCSTSDITINALESDESDPIQIKSQDCQTGRPRAKSVSHDSITLQWERSEYHPDSTIESYTVYYCTVNEAYTNKWGELYFKGGSNQVTVDRLIANKEYIFKVLPKCTVAQSIESEISEPIKTKPMICKPGKPVAFAAEKSHNSIRLEWSKPSPEYGYESIDFYIVYYRSTDDPPSSWKKHLVTDGHKEQSIISGLQPNKKYVFKVHPHCTGPVTVDSSEESDPFQIQLQELQVGKPQVSAVTHNSVTIQWEMPELSFDPKINSFMVSYRTSSESTANQEWTKQYCEGRNNYTTVTELQPNEQYVFKVIPKCATATYEIIESLTSDPIKTKTLVCKPGKPKVSTVANSHDSVHLEWGKPQYGHDEFESYIVSYSMVGDSSKIWRKKFSEGHQERITISGLAANKLYVFKVIPYNSSSSSSLKILESEESDPIQIKSQPSKPKAVQVSCDSVQLEWDMIGNSHNVDFYHISFRLHNDHHDRWRKQSTKNAVKNFTVTGLNPATSYVFKITSVNKTGDTSDGDTSDLITTSHTSKPSKPVASEVSDTCIRLTWTHPNIGSDSINKYTVLFCQATSNLTKTWESRDTDGSANEMVIASLTKNTKYLFKVRPDCGGKGFECESDVSDFVETKATSTLGELKASKITAKTIFLEWNKPRRGSDSIEYYKVYYKQADDSAKTWRESKSYQESIKITSLLPMTKYVFKIQPHCTVGTGAESDITKPFETLQMSKAGKPTVITTTHNSIHFKWAKPEHGKPKSYSCSYRGVNESEDKWKTIIPSPTAEEVVVTDLAPNTTYLFKVYPVYDASTSFFVDESISEWVATKKTPVAWRVKEKCKPLDGNVYKIPSKLMWQGEGNRIARYEVVFDHIPRFGSQPEKVLMLVGATGAGKSTLINGIVNYIFNVQFEDDFRFKLICDESDKGQTHSQTTSVNAYTIYPPSGSNLDYTLTIVDTPGFGDTRGTEYDKELFRQIKEFFTHDTVDHKGVDEIHGVGFVAKAPEVRLTATQKYISSNVLSVFGQNIKNNIFLMITFADGEVPPVIQAVQEEDFPYEEDFKFNNSALYSKANKSDPVTLPLWNMGQGSFRSFFDKFQNYKSKSLTLTKEVLEERERLESYVRTLREEITKAIHEIEKLELLQAKLQANEQNIDALKDFEIEVDVPKIRMVDLPRNHYVTNCLDCNHTCHKTCGIPNDANKYQCSVMTGNITTAHCTVCIGKCHWKRHVNNPYRIEVYTERVKQTLEDLKTHHSKAEGQKLTTEALIKEVEAGLEDLHKHIIGLVSNAQNSLSRLSQIALKPNPPSNEAYIDMLIEEERRDARTGFEKRITTLENLKKNDLLLNKVSQDNAESASGEEKIPSKPKKRWYHYLFGLSPNSDE